MPLNGQIRAGSQKRRGRSPGATEVPGNSVLAAGDGADDEEGLLAGRYGFRQWGVRRFVRPVLLAGEEAEEGPALAGEVVTNRSAERGITRFERVEDCPLRHLAGDFQLHIASHLCERSEMVRKHYANRANVHIGNKDPFAVEPGRIVTCDSVLAGSAASQIFLSLFQVAKRNAS